MQTLTGLKVIDLTRLLPGPLCTQIMADYGAEVIKIEEPGMGDPTRQFGPGIDEDSSFFWQLNRNKKSLAVNLRSPHGKKIFKRMVENYDVIVEGFRPGVMQRLGLGYDEISSINPGIVYASISGYGQDGPYREKAGHDLNYMALTGLLELNRSEGKSAPEIYPLQITDIGGGSLMALSSIMMALFKRSQTGQGDYIDISMADGAIPWLTYTTSYCLAGAAKPYVKSAELTGKYAFYNVYETKDKKYMSLAAVEPVFWQRFCHFAGRTDWVERQYDPDDQPALKEELSRYFAQKTRDQWAEEIKNEDFCCEPVLSVEEAGEHPQLKHRQYFTEVSRPEGGTSKQPGFPLQFNSDAGELRMPPPRLGQHSREVLAEAGLTEAEIQKLMDKGIVSDV